MQRSVIFCLPIFLFVGFLWASESPLTNSSNDDESRKSLWSDVKKAEQKGLPQTAIKALKEIESAAVADEKWDEATLAKCARIFQQAQIEQPGYPAVIKTLQADIPNSPEPMQPMLKAMLAEYIYTYYMQNQWRFRQRSQTAAAPGDDIETWDLARILNEVDKHFTEALKSSDELKKIPIGDYGMLLKSGNVDDKHRPTLFDFVAFQAIAFYSLDEQFIRQQGAFEITAESPVFASSKEFLQWKPDTTDDDSFLLRAAKLIQEVMSYHETDDDQTAFLDADLNRLQFARRVANGSEARPRYDAALQRFSDQHVDHPLSSLALGFLAESKQTAGDFVEAVAAAEKGLARFPKSKGAAKCQNIITRIKTKSVNLVTERVWNGDKIEVNLSYKNIDKVWFRLVKFDYANWKAWGNHSSPQNAYNRELAELLNRQPAKAWSHAIPATDDFKPHEEAIDVTGQTDGLASGCYVLISSVDESFSTNKKSDFESISLAEVWISELAMLVRQGGGKKGIEIQVLDAILGTPIIGAKVEKRAWVRNGRNSAETNAALSETNSDGIASFNVEQQGNQKFFVRSGEQKLGMVTYSNNYGNRRNRTSQQTIFFTDRSIYRPGQPIQFKGICYSSNSESNEYKTLTGLDVSVDLFDANNQRVETKKFRTNEFGSFTGTFTAPRDRVTGNMFLRSSVDGGQQRIRVEEYKRPKFFVDISKPSTAFRLGQQVTVNGSAIGYTGAAVDNAKVTWRVTRQVRYPFWCSCRYWGIPLNENSAEIANGESTTGVDGKFTIDFTAEPDKSVDRKYDPTFTYRIVADVTDSAGETRSDSQQIRIGYTSLQASLSAESWLTSAAETELKLKVTTLDGQGVESTGKLQIYALKSPEKIERAPFSYNNPRAMAAQNIKTWPTGELVSEEEVTTENADAENAGALTWKTTLKAGAYKAVFETTDPTGNKVLAELPLLVNDIDSDTFAVEIPNHFQVKQNSVQPGEEFLALWGTGYETGQAFIEIEHRGKVIKSWWTESEKTQTAIRIPIEEKHRGGLHLHITYVRDNRSYPTQHRIDVPWSNKKLKVKWEHFVSKLQPGGRETWTAVVSGPDAESVAAEMVASMYDASLDAFAPHSWRNSFNGFFVDYSRYRRQFLNQPTYANTVHQSRKSRSRSYQRYYRRFTDRTGISGFRGNFGPTPYLSRSRGKGKRDLASAMEMDAMPAAEMAFGDVAGVEMGASVRMSKGIEMSVNKAESDEESAPGDSESSGGIDLKQVQARKNLKETAFFFPQLQVGEDGTVRIEFEIPEALTKWKFQGFAHDNELKAALLTDDVTTSKDLMVQPNPPRFLREGDQLEFSVKVSNQSDKAQVGKIQLTFADARTAESVDEAFGNQQLEQTFDIPAMESRSLFWKINVPDFVGALTYKAIGGTETVSDGEEGFLPVLSKRILVTESLPLPIRGNQTKTFDFDRLEMAGKSDTLQSQSLTVQVASNPSWYAVMSLPYLMNYEHQCSEQTFNRLYANSLGSHIANSDPKIERIFEQWRGTETLDSPLEKNEELRNVLIAESPWLDSAKKESQARRDVGLLFDKNRMTNEIRQAQNKLAQMQLSDGAWPWFPGGRANDYITLYVTTGYGRLRHLNIDVDLGPAHKALDRLDWWINERYQRIKRNGNLDKDNLSADVCLYLYGRSFFLKDRPVNDKYKTAFDYFVDQGVKHWVNLGNRQSQGHLALALKRLGNNQTPAEIMKSLTERSVQQDELGMYWNEGERSWWWYKAPIETQALMIEAYDEILGDKAKVEELKIWLLKQKQTQNWKTTKATADACYGLLLRGTDLLASDKLVEVKLGDMLLKPENMEAGTGFYEQRFVRGEIKPEMGKIEMKKSDDGIAWGSIHWQYLEDVSKIEPYEGTPLTLKKLLYTKKNTDKGPVISEVAGPVEVGDELVMRVELRVDRAMEYVHLKDYRGSGTEPVNVLSKYKFQDGLMYYESTKDTATHFFIDYLPKGTYVFEYSVRVQHRGKYETGIAELQCMYAPEFNSHSGSVGIVVE